VGAAIIQQFWAELVEKNEALGKVIVDDGKCGEDFMNKFSKASLDDTRKAHGATAACTKKLRSAIEASTGRRLGADDGEQVQAAIEEADALMVRARAVSAKWGALTLLAKITSASSSASKKSLYDNLRESFEVHFTDESVMKHLDNSLVNDVKLALNAGKSALKADERARQQRQGPGAWPPSSS
jgi:hypothetical protein